MKQKNTNKNINVGNTFNGPTQMISSVVINSFMEKPVYAGGIVVD